MSAHISTRKDAMPDLYELTVAMAKCGEGRPVAEVAQAALDLVLGLWVAAEVTRDQALSVIGSQIESRFRERSN